MPRPTLAQLLIGGSIVAIGATLVAIPIALRESMRSRAIALGSRIERAADAREASPRRQPPPPCAGPQPDARRLPSALRQKLMRHTVPARVSRSLEADLPAGRTPSRATLAYAASLELDEVAWSAMACGRGEEPPFDFDLELLFMLRFAERLTAGGAACLHGAGEILHAGHAQAAWADEWATTTTRTGSGSGPRSGSPPGSCAAPPRRLPTRSRRSRTSWRPTAARHLRPVSSAMGVTCRLTRTYVVRILRDLDTYGYFPFTSDPEYLFEQEEQHLAVLEVGARIRADDLPTVVAALHDPVLAADRFRSRGLIDRYLDALVRHRMLALALFAIAGGSFEERLRDPRLADPLTGQPFDWDGEQLTTPGVRVADGGGVESIAVHVPR